jgi:Exo-beta-D-glucosaminidase Ig-fold domain/Glycosyl hydrolases family 2/Concanavalin A-like lectin/glucanases superfamily/Glycosyl hydrolases family 2, sugar binding domain/Glycosyl hydrolases family 2, TIM barrel domain
VDRPSFARLIGPISSAFRFICSVFLFALICRPSLAQFVPTNNPPQYGPYNAIFLRGGDGLRTALAANDTVTNAHSPWTLWCWVRFDEPVNAQTLIAGLGEMDEEYPRYLGIDSGKVVLWMGKNNMLSAPATLPPGKWHFLAVEFDGQEFGIYANGEQLVHGALVLGSVSPILQMAPPVLVSSKNAHFGGKLAGLVVVRLALSPKEIEQLAKTPPDDSLILYDSGSKPWPVQTHAQAGYRAPQAPSEMPRSNAPFSKPVAHVVPSGAALGETARNTWMLDEGWQLQAAPLVTADGATLTESSFDSSKWMTAVVPGTVLTTMIERGIYPDPEYGLNNLAIPESLNKQNYWYRIELRSPAGLTGKHLTLTFQGINYKAVVWLNGKNLGTIIGAFIRGTFDVSSFWKSGVGEKNILAVEVSPPPHPGIPQEQSVKGGPGENGGIMCLDGPTFVASEGWDWIPAVRDRETGIWQPVELRAVKTVKIGDTQVITKLPLPDTSRADIRISVPLENLLNKTVRGTLKASFEGMQLRKDLTLSPGKNTIALTPAEFKQLTVQNPRLWWPNGYGKPDLYHLKLSFDEGSAIFDTKEVRFGIREITYELSLLDRNGDLRRVDIDPTRGKEGFAGVVDLSHEGMREIPAADPPPPNFPKTALGNWHSWVASLGPDAESSSAVKSVVDHKASPYLVIKVNGVKIACRGGSWGMDDFLKRVSRERLEPYFRLHKEANINIIRNWVGQNTEETFFDLADEYGLLIWNDFWETTQNYNLEPEDPQLLLANVRDTILRFRNHPSIAIWCGRNEGVPQPIVNVGMANLINSLDGTRYYSPSSNQINLQHSGPYHYMDPKLYFTRLNNGFSVETGTPSFSTAEAFRASVPPEDLWPINDVWAYHDWHQSGNGDMAPFMEEMQSEFGAPTNFEDFERKAQMLDYVSHRAIFEGMNAHLWAPNTGRMLWMTQPAWASNVWEIFSHDYDTQSSFYGVKKACEPLHIQLDLSNYQVQAVNTTNASLLNATLSARVVSIDNAPLVHYEAHKDLALDSVTDGFSLDLKPFLAAGVVFVKLELRDSSGKLLSQNFYWLGAESSSNRPLDTLPSADVSASATISHQGNNATAHLKLENQSKVPLLQIKLTLVNAKDGSRVLPAYYDDNYISLLPGETRDITIEYATTDATSPVQIVLRGWNLRTQAIFVSGSR